MGARREYGKMTTNGKEKMEGDRWVAKGIKYSDME